ncbi:MAG: ComEC/Rec2 family competence protein [Candidatus Kapabacteria bacterium]|nr:ComEC/Rec2 family competence protein [Ignavibacteriota bacterium]MCW5886371.1 ComEC/Rec2 family competence protein [Candidatus Kapabacteria bacterium]
MKSSELPALKLFISVVILSLILSFWRLEQFYVIIISFGIALTSLAFLKNSNRDIAYLLLIVSLSLIISQRFDNHKIEIPKKILTEEKAFFSGEIVQLLKSERKYIRYIAKGNLNSENLPEINDTKVLLTVMNPKFLLTPGEKFRANIELNFLAGKLPGETFDYETYYKSNEIQWTAICNGRDFVKSESEGSLKSLSYSLRTSLKRKIFQVFDSTSAQIMTALLTGDKSMIDFDTRRNFSLSGTAHLLAVSGLHVGIISFLIFTLFSFISNLKIKSIAVILLLFTFVMITGWVESAVRASIMIAVYLLSINFEQRVNPLNSLAIAGLLMFLVNPDVIYSVSFRMSILSVAGIILFYEKFYELLTKSGKDNPLRNFFSASFSLTLSASLLISPLVAYYFGVYSFVSPLANLIVVPVMMFALSLGIAAIASSFIFTPLAEVYASAVSFLIKAANTINELSVSYKYSYFEGSMSIFIALIFSALLVYIIVSKNFKLRKFRISVSAVIVALAFLIIPDKIESEIEIIPRQNLTAVILNNHSQTYLLMFDRLPSNKLKQDFGIRQYILNAQKNIVVGYSGNAGISTIDAVKYDKQFQYYELDTYTQNRIADLLKLDIHPVKMIDLK